MPHRHGPHEMHLSHGWIEHDSVRMTRPEFGRELEALGKLIAENSEFTFNGVLISMPEEVDKETVFERNHHGEFVFRTHAAWSEFATTRHVRPDRGPKFGASPRAVGEA